MKTCMTLRGTMPLLAAASICCAVSAADFTVNPNKKVVLGSGGVSGIPCGTTSFTQSVDPVTITQFNSVSCNAGGLHTDNSYYRAFDSSAWGGAALTVCTVQIGIETAAGAGGSQPISCILYDSNDINNLGAPVANVEVQVPDQAMTLFNIPVVGAVTSGLVVEIFTPDGQGVGNSFFIGSNPNGETGPSYLAAADCGVVSPTPTGAIGFPGMNIVMTVFGDAGCVIGNCLGDTNNDGVVDVTDLVNVISGWGSDGLGQPGRISDLNCDGIVDVLDLVEVITGWGVCPAKNDECEDRITVGDGETEFTNLGATTNDNDAPFSCTSFGTNDIWYNYTATCTGNATISLCGSEFDTVLEVYSGFDCPPTTVLGCNDDFCDLQSELTLSVVEGDQLKIRIGGWMGDAGNGLLTISCTIANDNCEDRIVVGNGTTPFSNVGATTDGTPNALCDFFGDNDVQSDVWFNYFATDTGLTDINTFGSALDTKIAVYNGCDCPASDDSILACNDDAGGTLQSEVIIETIEGDCYKIRVGGFAGDQGEGVLNIAVVAPGACCFSDGSCGDGFDAADCPAAGGTFQGFGTLCSDVVCIAICGPGAGSCTDPNGNGTPGCEDVECCNAVCAVDSFCCDVVWDGICAGEAVTLCAGPGACCVGFAGECIDVQSGAECAALGGVYQGEGSTCDPNPCIVICGPGAGDCTDPNGNGTPGCEDPECCNAVCAADPFCCQVEWDTVCAGEAAAICGGPGACCFGDGSCDVLTGAMCIKSGGNYQGEGTTCDPNPCPQPPANDNCVDRIEVFAGETAVSNLLATLDGPAPCGLLGADVWYNYNPTSDGLVQIQTCGSGFDTVLAVYAGCDCPVSEANLIECNDDACGLQSIVTVNALAGECYKIQLGGFAGGTGDGILTIVAVEPGACCFPSGECGDGFDEAGCAGSGGIFQGFGTTCADVICIPICGPGAGGCFEANGSPGCEDTACCKLVCSLDPFCCDVTWDTICADEALANCSVEAAACCFGDGSCMMLIPADCSASGGAFQGAGTTCSPNPCPQPPTNDACDDRIDVGNGATPFSTVGTTTDGPAHPACLAFGDDQVSSDIWFNYNASGSGPATFSLCGSAYDTKIAVYGTCVCDDVSDATLLACNDDACGLQSEVSIDVNAGECYKIRVGGFGGAQGSGTLTITGPSGPGTGACCYPSGGCLDLTENQCDVSKGEFQGEGTSCGAGKTCPF